MRPKRTASIAPKRGCLRRHSHLIQVLQPIHLVRQCNGVELILSQATELCSHKSQNKNILWAKISSVIDFASGGYLRRGRRKICAENAAEDGGRPRNGFCLWLNMAKNFFGFRAK